MLAVTINRKLLDTQFTRRQAIYKKTKTYILSKIGCLSTFHTAGDGYSKLTLASPLESTPERSLPSPCVCLIANLYFVGPEYFSSWSEPVLLFFLPIQCLSPNIP